MSHGMIDPAFDLTDLPSPGFDRSLMALTKPLWPHVLHVLIEWVKQRNDCCEGPVETYTSSHKVRRGGTVS